MQEKVALALAPPKVAIALKAKNILCYSCNPTQSMLRYFIDELFFLCLAAGGFSCFFCRLTGEKSYPEGLKTSTGWTEYGGQVRLPLSTKTDELILSWAQFIINNRCGAKYMREANLPEALCDNNLSGRYDIVVGQIADGDVTQIAQACKRETRPVTSAEARNMLSKNFGMQYCLCTNNALAEITKQPRIKEGVQWR
jgi:hypothetical protein